MAADFTFNKRIDRVVRVHDKIRLNGVVHRVRSDGLIRSRPRLVRPTFPLQGSLLIAIFFIAFKSILFAQMGAGNYAEKVADLRQGSFVEQAGAVLMQDDPVTLASANISDAKFCNCNAPYGASVVNAKGRVPFGCGLSFVWSVVLTDPAFAQCA